MADKKTPASDATRLTVRADRATNSVILALENSIQIAIDAENIPQLHADIDKALKSLGYPGMPTIEERRRHIRAMIESDPMLQKYFGQSE